MSTARRACDACARRIEPAARTWTSKLSSTTALASASRMTAISSRGASSSSFTISWPRRAVVFQCTFRSDSPCSYSRTEWRSKPDGRRSSSRRPSCAWAPLSEKSRSSVDEPRVDEERPARVELDVHAREPERVVDGRARLLDDVAAARHPFEHVGAAVAAAGAGHRRHLLAEAGDPLRDRDAGRRHPRLGPDVEADPDVSALEQGALARSPPQLHRPRREPHPGQGADAARARARSRPGRAPWRRRARRRRTSPHPAAASANRAGSSA